jgi:hypothetical protein
MTQPPPAPARLRAIRRSVAAVLCATGAVALLGLLAAPAAATAARPALPRPETTVAAVLDRGMTAAGGGAPQLIPSAVPTTLPRPSLSNAPAAGDAATGGPVSIPPITLPALPTGGPTTAPTGPAPSTGGGGSHCGLIDVTCHVTAAINDWFSSLVSGALHPILGLLGRTVLATPNLTGSGQVVVLWGISAGIANAAFVLLVLTGGVIVMGYDTVQSRYTIKDIAPRLVFGLIAANASLALAGLAIGVANTLSAGLLGQPTGNDAATAISALVLGELGSGGIFLTLVAGVVAVLGLMLLVLYVLRIALLTVLIIGAPIALAGHALPQTDGLARGWWRALTACLGVQVGQSLVLIAAVKVLLAPGGTGLFGLGAGGGLVSLLVVLCLLLLLVQIPLWASKAVRSGRRPGAVGRAARDLVVYQFLRPAGIPGRHRTRR